MKANFDGDGVPIEIKKIVEQYSHQLLNPRPQIEPEEPKQTDTEFYQDFLLFLKEAIKKGLITTQPIEDDVPQTTTEENNQITQQIEDSEQEKIEEERRKEQEDYINKVVLPQERKQIDNFNTFSSNLELFHKELLSQPSESLLPDIYKPKQDHYLTLKILKSFEFDGVIPSNKDEQEENVLAQNTLVQNNMSDPEAKSNPAPIMQVEVAVPSLHQLKSKLKEGPNTLITALDEIKKKKATKIEQLTRDLKLSELLLAAQMGQMEKQKSNQWTEYLSQAIIKSVEDASSTTIKLPEFEHVIKDILIADRSDTPETRMKVQKQNPIQSNEEKQLLALIKSKL
ncbi:hypothetical protein AKO1_014023 [Acrasis kona]|uniref:Uncharacterized protein n=1 Tax=Acrasis kona TaxID=1008807 RepID=A0AAW2Z336_9EUKA